MKIFGDTILSIAAIESRGSRRISAVLFSPWICKIKRLKGKE
jgi:hypothetical protein